MKEPFEILGTAIVKYSIAKDVNGPWSILFESFLNEQMNSHEQTAPNPGMKWVVSAKQVPIEEPQSN